MNPQTRRKPFRPRRAAPVTYPLFVAAFLITLALGALAGEREPSARELAAELAGFVVAFLCQRSLFDEKTLFGSDPVEPDDELFIAGRRIRTGAGINEEEKRLEQARTPWRRLGVKLGFAAVAGVYALSSAWLHLPFWECSFLQTLVALAIVPAMSLNHFLVPLSLSLVAVLFRFRWTGVEPLLPAVLFFAALGVTLILYRAVELELARGSTGRLEEAPIVCGALRSAAACTVVFLGLLLLADVLVPSEKTQESFLAMVARKFNHGQKAVTQRIAGGIAGRIAGRVQRQMQMQSQRSDFGGQGFRGQGQTGPGKVPDLSMIKDLKIQLPASGSGTTLDENPPQGGTFREDGSAPNVAPEAAKLAMKELPRLKAGAEAGGAAGTPEPSAPTATSAPAAESVSTATSPPAAASAAPSTAQSTGSAPGDAPDPQAERQKIAELAQGLEPQAASGEKASAPPSPSWLPKLPELSEATLRRLFLAAAAVLLLFFFRRVPLRFDSRDKPARAKLSREKRRQLLGELAELNRMRVDPREEVLARYRFFLKLMELAQHPKRDYLPAEDYLRDELRPGFPGLAKHSENITYTFCDTLYGELEVTPERIRGYRQSIEAWLRHFGC